MVSELRVPMVRLAMALAAVLALTITVLVLRLAQPHLDMTLVAAPDGSAVQVMQVAGQPHSGTALAILPATPDGQDGVALRPDLLIEDPDMLGSYDGISRFYADQGRLWQLTRQAAASGGSLRLSFTDSTTGGVVSAGIPVRLRSTLADLPPVFWVQLATGFVVLVIAAFFLALRRGAVHAGTAPEGLAGFIIAGLGVGGAAYAAALYSTRSLVMEPQLMALLSVCNHAATYFFGIGMIALFARYPRPVLAWTWVHLASGLIIAALLLYRLQLLPHEVVRPQNAVGLIFCIILALVVAQLRATRRRPADRAALRWLGLSFLLGSGVFVLLVALPVALERDGIMSQGMAFIPLCAIYVGTALALARYRLFDLDRWAWRVLFHMAMIGLLVLVDLGVLLSLSLSGPASLASAVALVGLVYFPLRDRVFDRWLAPKRPDLAMIYGETVSVAFQIGQAAKSSAWTALLHRLFTPLHQEALVDGPAQPVIGAEGLALEVPAQGGAPALRLSYAEGGRRLFNSADAALVAQMSDLVAAAERDRAAYETALHQERRRIARDLHDDVGSRLLSSLHSRDEGKRQEFLVDALADLRQIASGLAGREVTLETLIGEMRAESRNRAEAHGRSLIWPLGSADEANVALAYDLHRNFTAMHREALSNALGHGGAGPIRVQTDLRDGMLVHRIENPLAPDEAYAPPSSLRGNGVANIRARAAALHGQAKAGPDLPAGLYRLELRLPLVPLPQLTPQDL
ncbi:hypothetical protein Q9299_03860 [Gemmobacter fulvus]|uniref:sensor histidine kinase n=1 Tax=Gemmobacter fulvus TaxID=2840474 RepID=UPI002796E073|nr:hypothetical protein [Gemmobacter fulvus]MDQ1847413.1 hypothetical protein [Gemmobacter fulvus]